MESSMIFLRGAAPVLPVDIRAVSENLPMVIVSREQLCTWLPIATRHNFRDVLSVSAGRRRLGAYHGEFRWR